MAIFKSLSENETDPDPFIQFDKWYVERLASGIEVPEAVILGTSSSAGRVSARVVLLKEHSEKGFVFYTNYHSKKASHLMSNHHAALLFYWPESGRQIRVEGVTAKVSDEESDEYFKSRPRESQISSWASNQSSVVPGRNYVEKQFDVFRSIFDGKPVPRPEHWGGFRLIPTWFEFWQERDYRLHDRLTYTKKENRWLIERLAP
jgi:pyridoxamine 5'-phosphate oxidase